MKIVICVKRDLAGNIALNKVVREIRGHELFVILSDSVTQAERSNRDAASFVFYERDLIVEQIHPLLDRAPLDPGSEPRYLTFDQLGKRHGIQIELMGNINAPLGRARLEEIGPDVVLSIRYDYIFKKHIIDIPAHGIINIHPGEVPKYRGVFAPFRAMLHGEKRMCCSVFLVDEGIDTGPLVGTGWLPVDYSKSALWHAINLYPIGVDVFIEALSKIERDGSVPTIEQSEENCSYYTWPTPGEFREFGEKGCTLIDNDEYLEFLSGFRGP